MTQPIICSPHESHREIYLSSHSASVRVRFGAVKQYKQVDIDFPKVKSILSCKNKVKMKEIFIRHGVRTPVVELLPTACNLPLIYKLTEHSSGKGTVVIRTPSALRENYNLRHGYYEQFVSIEKEYRVHVMDGKAFHTDVKRLRRRGKPSDIRNLENYVFKACEDPPADVIYQALLSVSALDLDFGAVDIGYDGQSAWVFEVNTAPGMRPSLARKYSDQLDVLIEKKIEEL